VVTRTTDEREATALAQMCGVGEASHWQHRLATLTIGEAVLLPTVEGAGGHLWRFRLAARLTSHIRHRQKCLDVNDALAQIMRDRYAGFTEGDET
jgi:hypothetical protein